MTTHSQSVAEEDVNSTEDDGDKQADEEPVSFLRPLPPLLPSLASPAPPLSDQAYLQASAIFQQLRQEKPVTLQLLHYGKKIDTRPPEQSGDRSTQRQAYQLAFSTLKYQDLLEEIITDSCFHSSQHISTDLLPLAMVMLFDLQDRRFVTREHPTSAGLESLQEVRELEVNLHRCKTKLAASLARCRVKLNLRSVSCFLSDSVRSKQQRAKHLPLYAWVDTLKTSVDDVCRALRDAGLRERKSVAELEELTFCRDRLCADTLVFPRQLHAALLHSSLSGTLNIQDRSACVAVSALRPLLFDHGDVLVAGSFSAVTVAHVAVAAAERSGRVLACGADRAASQVEEIRELLSEMNVSNVRILSEAFCDLKEWDASVQRLKVIMVLPQCSSTALNDPVSTIHSEHGNWDLLPDLSHGSVSKGKINSMAGQQAQLLAHALTFPKVQTVVYCTRSVYPEENEQLVKRVLERTHTHPKLLPFRVNGPVFPDDSGASGDADADDSKFFRLEPSQFTNGCFIARLSRQADPTKVETVQDVLARAAAKGLLGGIMPEQQQSKTVKKGKSKKKVAAQSPGSSQGPGSTGDEKAEGRAAEEEEEEEEEEGEEGELGKEEVGKRSKGHKRKVKRRAKQAKNPATKGHKKKKKVNRKRRIPRLTLTLMSSAQPSSHLSPITALAHRISENTSSAGAAKHPSPPTETLEDGDRAGGDFKERKKVARAKDVVKPADAVLPPIPCRSSSSSSSSSSVLGSSLSHLQQTSMSASSSTASLPGL